MLLRSSTGRKSPVKHSTGAEPAKVAKARRGHPRTRYSTGESASIAHFTGRETDHRALEKRTDVPAEIPPAASLARWDIGRPTSPK